MQIQCLHLHQSIGCFTNIFGVTDSASDSYRCWEIGYSVAETPTATGGNGWSGTARTNIGDNYTSQ